MTIIPLMHWIWHHCNCQAYMRICIHLREKLMKHPSLFRLHSCLLSYTTSWSLLSDSQQVCIRKEVAASHHASFKTLSVWNSSHFFNTQFCPSYNVSQLFASSYTTAPQTFILWASLSLEKNTFQRTMRMKIYRAESRARPSRQKRSVQW